MQSPHQNYCPPRYICTRPTKTTVKPYTYAITPTKTIGNTYTYSIAPPQPLSIHIGMHSPHQNYCPPRYVCNHPTKTNATHMRMQSPPPNCCPPIYVCDRPTKTSGLKALEASMLSGYPPRYVCNRPTKTTVHLYTNAIAPPNLLSFYIRMQSPHQNYYQPIHVCNRPTKTTVHPCTHPTTPPKLHCVYARMLSSNKTAMPNQNIYVRVLHPPPPPPPPPPPTPRRHIQMDFSNENFCISNRISLTFIPKGPIENIQAPSHYLNQCLPSLLTHICDTRGRWVKW